jgi:ribosome-associated heat shock protein Hsp15
VRTTDSPEPAPGPAPEHVRLDAWLDVACLFKTRSAAQKACRAGQVEVGGQACKPHRLLKAGEEIRITRGPDRVQTVVVRALAEKHVARAQARQLYQDLTPPPTPEQLEERRIERLLRQAQPEPPGSPHRRDRRTLRQLRGKD